APASCATPPSNKAFLAIAARRGLRSARDAYRRLFLLEYWNVGIIEAPIEQVAATGRPLGVRWLPAAPRHRFYADPFAAEDRSDVVMMEEYDYRSAGGRIVALSLEAQSVVPRPIAAFASTQHRSYPYLFTADGTVFCVPETSADNRVMLYRAASYPDKWQRVGTLIDGFAALDSTIFAHDGRWWLVCTSAAPGCEHKLYAWYSETLTGPWRPHRLNPIKEDVTSARPAGRPFPVRGALCRPAQDCSRGYGGAITLNLVVRLTPTCFEEQEIGRIEPVPDSEFPDGIHTICAAGGRTIVDGKRLVFDWRALFLKWRASRQMTRGATLLPETPPIDAEAFSKVLL
ncbi:MAG: glucosamine inositolphosphorylceramide transferase family protein, partial [Stellaceae bacterium]